MEILGCVILAQQVLAEVEMVHVVQIIVVEAEEMVIHFVVLLVV